MNSFNFAEQIILSAGALVIIGALLYAIKRFRSFWPVLVFTLDWIILAMLLPMQNNDFGIITLAKFQHICLILLSVSWVYFTLQFTGVLSSLRSRHTIPAILVPTLSIILIISNDYHGWVWLEYELSSETPVHMLAKSPGFWYWGNMAVTIGFFLLGFILLARKRITSIQDLSWENTVFLLLALTPLIAAGSFFYFQVHLPTSLILSITGLLMIWILEKITNSNDSSDHKEPLAPTPDLSPAVPITPLSDIQLETWVKVLEMRDYEPQGHCARLQVMVKALAEKSGVTTSIDELTIGVALHDLGNLLLPDQVLMKTSPLSLEDWEVIQQHPGLAVDLLKDLPIPKPSLDIIRCHHEKWDGSGYPFGLSGTEIPLPARLFSIMDIWDSMVSPKIYRKAHPRQKAWQFIQDQSGIHLDPDIVQVFQALMRENPDFLEGL